MQNAMPAIKAVTRPMTLRGWHKGWWGCWRAEGDIRLLLEVLLLMLLLLLLLVLPLLLLELDPPLPPPLLLLLPLPAAFGTSLAG
jgi:hypothetical protein